MSGRLLCLNEEDLHIHGHYNGDDSRMFLVNVKKCVAKEFCADQQTIMDYFRGTYVNIMSNQIRFDYREFSHKSLIHESTLVWTAVSTQL